MPNKKLIVFGGNGFVGSRIVQKALAANWSVVVACRSGAPVPLDAKQPWVKKVEWRSVDALDRPSVYTLLDEFPDVSSVISSIGLLSLDHRKAKKINGEANVNIATAIKEKGGGPNNRIGKFVFVSAMDYGWPINRILSGYFEGKNRTMKEMKESLPNRSASLLPGMIYGPRALYNGMTIPLQWIGRPLEIIFRPLYGLTKLGLFAPAIHVEKVAEAAVHLSGTREEECGKYDYYGIQHLAEKYQKFDHFN